MNRRLFLSALTGGLAFDPERLLWVPRRKVISIPKPAPVAFVLTGHITPLLTETWEIATNGLVARVLLQATGGQKHAVKSPWIGLPPPFVVLRDPMKFSTPLWPSSGAHASSMEVRYWREQRVRYLREVLVHTKGSEA